MIYFTSDLHFLHNEPFIYEHRGFSSIKEHDKALIKNWNETITDEDLVFVLGDIALGGCSTEALNIVHDYIEQLNGEIVHIRGNHDSERRCDMYHQCRNIINTGFYATEIDYDDYHFYLSHYPTITSNFDNEKPLRQRLINLCGHSHTSYAFSDWFALNSPIIHCDVDAHKLHPVSIEQIINEMNKYSEQI